MIFRRTLLAAAVGLTVISSSLVATADTVSAITSNFNNTSVSSGSYLWFTAVGKLNSTFTSPFTVYLTNSQITFTSTDSSHTSVVVNTPNAAITFGASGTVASDSFNSATNTWNITAAYNASGNILFDAGAYLIPSGININGANPVTWTATFNASDPNMKLNWSWAAAAYSSSCTLMGSTSTYGSLGVVAADGSTHAGTPTNCATAQSSDYLEPGARGGGGSNWTGSLSGTTSATPTVSPEPGSLALLGSGLIGLVGILRRKR